MHHRKALVCLNPKCSGNHYLHDCMKTSNQDKVTIFVAAKEKWKAETAVWKRKQVETLAGQAHMQVSVEDIEEQQWHQDNYLDALAFIQASEGHDAIQ